MNQNPEFSSNLNKPLFNHKRIYRSWLLLCYCTGPVASLSRTYVPAAIQSATTLLGKTKNGELCSFIGNDCYINFGTGTVNANSYVLYLKAIATSLEGVLALFVMGIADYSNYRKLLLIGSILFYGVCALPFAGLTAKTSATLKGLLALYIMLQITDSVYQILEGSYIPLFMRHSTYMGGPEEHTSKIIQSAEEIRKQMVLKRGSTVSVMGLFLSNFGGITALLIGLVISYTRGGPTENGYHNFLLAITIAGCLTVVCSILASFFIPSIEGKPKPSTHLLYLTMQNMWQLLKNIRKYPQAFLFCVSWVIWNVSYSNFLSVFVLLFRSTLGLGSSDSEYTIYTFMSYIIGSVGPLLWMYLYPRANIKIQVWGHGFLLVQLFCNLWGCLGISSRTGIGFKSRWEFWAFEVFFNATGSSLRALNRTVYSTLLPAGEEAQYFGLEIFLGIATSWIGNLLNATIQDKTHNQRFPFLPNLFLVVIALVLYCMCDTEKGMKDVEKLTSNITDDVEYNTLDHQPKKDSSTETVCNKD